MTLWVDNADACKGQQKKKKKTASDWILKHNGNCLLHA